MHHTKKITSILAVGSAAVLALGAVDDMPRLTLKDGHFRTPSGKTQRFWGMNLVSAFPTHDEADGMAANLAELGVNLARPHHLMRPSKDWVWRTPSPAGALVDYKSDSRTPDPETWDRFDYLAAALRKRGIRLVHSMHHSRKFMPGDAAILQGDSVASDDTAAWHDAVKELNSWGWKESIDPVKALPVIDRRARLLQKEFVRNLLTHKNPYTGLTYGEDPQSLYIEIVNESSLEYALVCDNKFPAFFENNLQAAWQNFAKKAGVAESGNLRHANKGELGKLRADFFRAIEDDYFRDMIAFVRDELRSPIPVACGNLWRGNDALAAYAGIGDVVEEHHYVHPSVVNDRRFWADSMANTLVAGKPYFLGEFNFTENPNIAKQFAYARPMLMLSAAAYGALHDIDGVVWFAYNHGDRNLGPDGRGKIEQRDLALGDMATDSVMLDHMATCAALFRSGALKPAAPVLRDVAVPRRALTYNELMTDTATPPPGAMSVRSYRKRFVKPDSATAPDYSDVQDLTDVFMSETGQIIRDLAHKQFVVAAPQAEAFSGFLTGTLPQNFRHLTCADAQDVATVIAVALDSKPIAQSRRVLISRTWMNEKSVDREGLAVALRNMPRANWHMRVVRPRAAAATLRDLTGSAAVPLKQSADGTLTLPTGTWTQVELIARD